MQLQYWSQSRFSARKTRIFTLLGRRHTLFLLTTWPAMLKTRLHGTDVARFARYLVASWESSGYLLLSPHYSKGDWGVLSSPMYWPHVSIAIVRYALSYHDSYKTIVIFALLILLPRPSWLFLVVTVSSDNTTVTYQQSLTKWSSIKYDKFHLVAQALSAFFLYSNHLWLLLH